MTFSQERIFKLLGMKTSFYVTPEIRENLIEMTFRRNEDGVLEKWDKQLKVTEQDPAKCAWKLFTFRLLSDNADLNTSQAFTRGYWPVFLPWRLLDSFTTPPRHRRSVNVSSPCFSPFDTVSTKPALRRSPF